MSGRQGYLGGLRTPGLPTEEFWEERRSLGNPAELGLNWKLHPED